MVDMHQHLDPSWPILKFAIQSKLDTFVCIQNTANTMADTKYSYNDDEHHSHLKWRTKYIFESWLCIWCILSKMYLVKKCILSVSVFPTKLNLGQKSTYRMISTLIGWNRIVSLGCFANGTKNTAIEYNECQYWNESQSHRVGNQHIIPGVFQIFTEFCGSNHGIFDLFGDVSVHGFIENCVVFIVEFRPKFKESWDVENYTENVRFSLTVVYFGF